MKQYFGIKMVVVSSLLFGLGAEARQYRCKFNSPAFDLEISTQDRKVTKTSQTGDSKWRITESKRVTLVGETRDVFILDSGEDVQVSLTDPSKDTTTGYFYPFAATFSGARGGCESEENEDGAYIARNKSLVNQLGEVVVNNWPGEFGAYQGYLVTKKVTLPQASTWQKLVAFGRDFRSCTLKKGTRFLPFKKRAGEAYVSLSRPQKYVAKFSSGLAEDDFSFRQGDQIISISPESEGYCLVEKEGVRYDVNCLDSNGKLFGRIDTKVELKPDLDPELSVPAEGEYVYTKCIEGHSTWVPVSLMKRDKANFKATTLRPL